MNSDYIAIAIATATRAIPESTARDVRILPSVSHLPPALRVTPFFRIHVLIRLGQAFNLEDWYVQSGGKRHLCL
jgi:hypothetical protein